ncbi:GST-like protein yfcG [Serratia fonticola]|uniref:GST-like protein yfcG n=1 Tax=Serratia fonticola TaxID=47917 RepID=A0A448SZV4_SERFO|nr:GST-like protein yfcG [Serratia fonticola]
MIDLYYAPTPNGHKITLLLEEVGLPYRIHRVNISAGDQFTPAFLAISPNNKIPAIVDQQPVDGGAPSACLNRARSCSIWQRKPANCSAKGFASGQQRYSGYFGRLPDLGRCSGKIITSTTMHRNQSPTR